MQERFWPVHAIDVGEALEQMLLDDSTAEQTYELYGPTEYTMGEIAELVDKEIMKKRRHYNIPRRVMEPFAWAMNRFLWWPTLSKDAVSREFIDQVIDPKAKTFADLGIEPAELKDWSFEYLVSSSTPVTTRLVLTNFAERISQLSSVRPPTHDGAGKARREEIPARPRRPIDSSPEISYVVK